MRLRVMVLVALVLALVASGYFVVVANELPRDRTSTTPIVSFQGSTSFSYVAAIKPNPLYNVSTLTPGHGTLLVGILRTLALSYTFELNLTPASDVSVGIGERVSVVAPALNFTLNASTEPFATQAGAGSVTFHDRLLLNVTSTFRLLSQITNATAYNFNVMTLRYTAVVFATISQGGRNTVFITEPSFNLTLVNSQYFAPTNFTSPFAQSINLTSKSADPTASFYRTASDSVLAALLLALAGVGYLVWRPERTPSGPVDEEAQVEAMTAPYQDAISSTLSLPHRENVVILREWDDLVHSADMLSKPILHLESRVEDRTRHIFYLVDGAVQYVYLHHVLPPPAADPHPWRSRLRELFGGPTSTVSSASRRRRPPPHGPPPIDEWSPPRAESGTRNGSGRAPGRPDEVPPGARR